MTTHTAHPEAGRDAALEIREELVRSGMIGPPADGDDPASTRQRVLEAAITQFADRGFHACTMRDLGSAVGIKAPAIYNHFDSKEQILAQASREVLRRFCTAVLGPLVDDPEDERFERTVKRWVSFQIEEREVTRANDALLDTGALRRILPKEDWERIATAIRHVTGLLATFVTAEADGEIDADLLSRVIPAVCDRAALVYRPGGPLSTEQIAHQAWLMCHRMVSPA